MTYLDTSVALAHLLGQERHPPDFLWQDDLVSSRLLLYEIWTRINALKLTDTHGEAARQLVGKVALLELAPQVLGRALEPFPVPVRTLDALHLASMDFLRRQGQAISLASYDDHLTAAAVALGIPIREA